MSIGSTDFSFSCTTVLRGVREMEKPSLFFHSRYRSQPSVSFLDYELGFPLLKTPRAPFLSFLERATRGVSPLLSFFETGAERFADFFSFSPVGYSRRHSTELFFPSAHSEGDAKGARPPLFPKNKIDKPTSFFSPFPPRQRLVRLHDFFSFFACGRSAACVCPTLLPYTVAAAEPFFLSFTPVIIS